MCEDVFTLVRTANLLLFKAICWVHCLWFERVNGLSNLKFFVHNFLRLKKNFQENPVLLDEFINKFSPNGEKIILLVGRLDKTRRTRDLIQAYQNIMLECPNVSLVIVGDGSERAKNEQKVKELGLKNVHFEGAIYDDELLAKYYMVSDFFVTPGVASMAIKIAMLFGIPVGFITLVLTY